MKEWVLAKFQQGLDTHPEWEEKVKRSIDLFASCQMPDHEEVSFAATFFKVKLVVKFYSNDPIQCEGDDAWPKLVLSNIPSVDEAGNAAPHFHYIWECYEPDGKDPAEHDTPEKAISYTVPIMFLCRMQLLSHQDVGHN